MHYTHIIAGILLSLLVRTGRAELLLFGFDATSDHVLTIDTSMGNGSSVGPLGFGQVGDIAGNSNGQLFASNRDTDQLFSVNMQTGAGTLVGGFGAFTNVNGLAFNSSGILYGFDDGTDQIITIDTTTGAATAVVTVDNTNVSGIAFDSSDNLFATDSAAGNLLSIDLGTGMHSVIGSYGLAAGSVVSSLSFDGAGVLYAADAGVTDSLYTVNVTTGEAALVGATGFSTVSAISFAATIPEPGTMAGLSLLGVGFAVVRIRQRRKRSI